MHKISILGVLLGKEVKLKFVNIEESTLEQKPEGPERGVVEITCFICLSLNLSVKRS